VRGLFCAVPFLAVPLLQGSKWRSRLIIASAIFATAYVIVPAGAENKHMAGAFGSRETTVDENCQPKG
jgi:hypothetical protein